MAKNGDNVKKQLPIRLDDEVLKLLQEEMAVRASLERVKAAHKKEREQGRLFNQLREGVKSWNRWRSNNPDIEVDLSHADLVGIKLIAINFSDAKT
jgi:hypothetical protein